jgi:hypothetical protein
MSDPLGKSAGMAMQEHAVIGWRGWSIKREGQAVLLASPDRHALWPAGASLAAERCHYCDPMHESHRPVWPHDPDACLCGINAFASREQLGRSAWAFKRVIGEVELTGQVRGFDAGWRASHARPRRLWARASKADCTALSRAYGCPVERLTFAAQLRMWSASVNQGLLTLLCTLALIAPALVSEVLGVQAALVGIGMCALAAPLLVALTYARPSSPLAFGPLGRTLVRACMVCGIIAWAYVATH